MVVLNLQIPVEKPTPEEVEEALESFSPSQHVMIESNYCTAEELVCYFRFMAVYGTQMPFMLDTFIDSWRNATSQPQPKAPKDSGIITPDKGLYIP